jgi:XTP/dITP diphosphohydrolase
MQELVVATKNKKKLEEIRVLLKGCGVKVLSLSDFTNAPRIIENGSTFKDNAIKKAAVIARFTGKFTLGEDSGLCVKALGGRPGVYSSRFAGKNKSDAQNNLKLLEELAGVPLRKRSAYYACAVALADSLGPVAVTEGKCAGLIGFAPQGHFGFGYDPLFIIPRYKKTFAQLGPSIKHTMSHRYRALVKAKKIILRYRNAREGI